MFAMFDLICYGNEPHHAPDK